MYLHIKENLSLKKVNYYTNKKLKTKKLKKKKSYDTVFEGERIFI